MMSIGKLAAGPGAGRYYIDQVAQGREDYYAGEGEAAGVWMGTGAAWLGLTGEVGEEGLARLLEGRDPVSGLLLRPARSSSPVAGFDLTFRAPKSVSILFGVAEPEVARRVVARARAAVAQAIGYLEREACWTRRGRGGAIRLPGRGFVAAAFRHRSSRAGDPLLHTHVVVANATQAADGRWTALDGRALYRHAKTAGYLYQAVAAGGADARARRALAPVEHGTRGSRGRPAPGDRALLAAAGGDPRAHGRAGRRRRARRRSRRSRRAGARTTACRSTGCGSEWRARAAEHGLDRAALVASCDRARSVVSTSAELAERLEGRTG